MYLDRCYLVIDGETIDCESAKVAATNDLDAVPTMNRAKRAKGFKSGVMKYEIEAEVPMDPDLEVNFDELMEEGVEFPTVFEYEGGSTHTYTPCRIGSVDRDSKDGEVTKYSLKIKALDRVEG